MTYKEAEKLILLRARPDQRDKYDDDWELLEAAITAIKEVDKLIDENSTED